MDNTVVTMVDHLNLRVRVQESSEWKHLDDIFQLACFGTHKRPRAWASVDRESFDDPPVIPPPPTPPVATLLAHALSHGQMNKDLALSHVVTCVRLAWAAVTWACRD